MTVLQTARLRLRHFTAGDFEAMCRVFCDAEVMRYSDGIQDEGFVKTWLEARAQAPYQSPWAVLERTSNTVLGYCGLFEFPDINGRPETEVGYRLARAHWGNGYATEAVRGVIEYAFTTLGLPRLIALIDPHNRASLRVAQKSGLRFEAEFMPDGYDRPDLVYGIARHARSEPSSEPAGRP